MDRREGRRVWMRGFSDQWGEEEREEREEERVVSLEWMVCQRPLKDLTVREERRRTERRLVMRERRVCGEEEEGVVAAGFIWVGLGRAQVVVAVNTCERGVCLEGMEGKGEEVENGGGSQNGQK